MHMQTLHGSHTPCLMQVYLRDLCKSEQEQTSAAADNLHAPLGGKTINQQLA